MTANMTSAIKRQHRVVKVRASTFAFVPLPPGSPRSLLTIEEVGEMLLLDRHTIKALITLNLVPSHVPVDNLTDFFNAQYIKAAPAKAGGKTEP